jgi:hypothetical protein
MRKDGKFLVGDDIPEGQGSVNELLAECFELSYELRVAAEPDDVDVETRPADVQVETKPDCLGLPNPSEIVDSQTTRLEGLEINDDSPEPLEIEANKK